MSRPSMIHPCSPPPSVEIHDRGLQAGDQWSCPHCGDPWQLDRDPDGGLLSKLTGPSWIRVNDPA